MKMRMLRIRKVTKGNPVLLLLLFTCSVIVGVSWIPRKRSILNDSVISIANSVATVDVTPSTPTNLNNVQ